MMSRNFLLDMDLAHDAIQAALRNDWVRAIELNEELYKKDQQDLGTILRLAHAHFEGGNPETSKEYAEKALEIDPTNFLAKKCLEKCIVGKNPSDIATPKKANLKAFLEIPGKTRLVHLVHLGEPKTLIGLCSGEPVNLEVNSHRVSVETTDGEHVGRVPDDIVARMNKHSQFWAAIKYAGATEVSIVIHER